MLRRGERPLVRWMKSVSHEGLRKTCLKPRAVGTRRSHAAVDTEPLAQVYGAKRHSVMCDIQGEFGQTPHPTNGASQGAKQCIKSLSVHSTLSGASNKVPTASHRSFSPETSPSSQPPSHSSKMFDVVLKMPQTVQRSMV